MSMWGQVRAQYSPAPSEMMRGEWCKSYICCRVPVKELVPTLGDRGEKGEIGYKDKLTNWETKKEGEGYLLGAIKKNSNCCTVIWFLHSLIHSWINYLHNISFSWLSHAAWQNEKKIHPLNVFGFIRGLQLTVWQIHGYDPHTTHTGHDEHQIIIHSQ